MDNAVFHLVVAHLPVYRRALVDEYLRAPAARGDEAPEHCTVGGAAGGEHLGGGQLRLHEVIHGDVGAQAVGEALQRVVRQPVVQQVSILVDALPVVPQAVDVCLNGPVLGCEAGVVAV